MLPNEKIVLVKIDHDSDSFIITDLNGEKLTQFEGISSIILHDVLYDEVGVFYGKYLKPKHLQHYDDNVDKSKFPRYIDWCLDSDDAPKFLEKDLEYENIYKASDDEKMTVRISEDGKFKNGFDEYVKNYKRIFLVTRMPYNTNKSITTMTIF